ncbi:MAG: SDR family oxidoreductase [Myxococcales bacterium]|nr:SDR family oxidoreductase [Myxococcales bacterium]MCB9753080.1 SDR family oxidoreductase [Myxococcales bacterium]
MKTILITGAAAGIGLAAAERFHRGGWSVGMTDIDDVALTRAARSLGDERVWTHALDVTDADAVREVVTSFAAARGGSIRAVLNNAGLLKTGRFAEITPEAHRRLVDVNITGLINVSHAAHRFLRGAPGATLVNMSSASALHGTPDFATYSATKAAVRALTEALEIEWQGDKIAVRDVMPPFVNTGMVQTNQSVLIDRFGVQLKPADVAETIWDVVTRRSLQVHHPVGWRFRVATLASDLMPSRLMHEALRLMSRAR